MSEDEPKPIWAKGADTKIDARLAQFTAGEDVVLDRELILWDTVASSSHVHGLKRIGVLTEDEADALVNGLADLQQEIVDGSFVLDERFEDGHSAIEAYLIGKLGDVGKKVHTGRSRNDQVLVATRMFIRSALEQVEYYCGETAAAFLERAEETMQMPMPGYTHLQRAVPSTVGMWFAAFSEAFVDNAVLVRSIRNWVNANPLGTAAGYGVNLPLDRDFTTSALGFSRLQISPIYAQNSRGKFELAAIDALGQALLDVRRFAWDVSLYTTAEFAFVDLPDRYTTGSSIMPNKRNPDVIELLRAAYAPVEGARSELTATLSLPSGYHRDLQNTKPPMIRAFKKGLAALELLPDLVRSMTLNADRMAAAISSDMYATDVAIELSAAGTPFREAYREAAKTGLDTDREPRQSIDARVSPGGAANPRLDLLKQRLADLEHGD